MIGQCDLCYEDNRHLIEVEDFFGVHVMNICLHGCNNQESIEMEDEK